MPSSSTSPLRVQSRPRSLEPFVALKLTTIRVHSTRQQHRIWDLYPRDRCLYSFGIYVQYERVGRSGCRDGECLSNPREYLSTVQGTSLTRAIHQFVSGIGFWRALNSTRHTSNLLLQRLGTESIHIVQNHNMCLRLAATTDHRHNRTAHEQVYRCIWQLVLDQLRREDPALGLGTRLAVMHRGHHARHLHLRLHSRETALEETTGRLGQ